MREVARSHRARRERYRHVTLCVPFSARTFAPGAVRARRHVLPTGPRGPPRKGSSATVSGSSLRSGETPRSCAHRTWHPSSCTILARAEIRLPHGISRGRSYALSPESAPHPSSTAFPERGVGRARIDAVLPRHSARTSWPRRATERSSPRAHRACAVALPRSRRAPTLRAGSFTTTRRSFAHTTRFCAAGPAGAGVGRPTATEGVDSSGLYRPSTSAARGGVERGSWQPLSFIVCAGAAHVVVLMLWPCCGEASAALAGARHSGFDHPCAVEPSRARPQLGLLVSRWRPRLTMLVPSQPARTCARRCARSRPWARPRSGCADRRRGALQGVGPARAAFARSRMAGAHPRSFGMDRIFLLDHRRLWLAGGAAGSPRCSRAPCARCAIARASCRTGLAHTGRSTRRHDGVAVAAHREHAAVADASCRRRWAHVLPAQRARSVLAVLPLSARVYSVAAQAGRGTPLVALGCGVLTYLPAATVRRLADHRRPHPFGRPWEWRQAIASSSSAHRVAGASRWCCVASRYGATRWRALGTRGRVEPPHSRTRLVYTSPLVIELSCSLDARARRHEARAGALALAYAMEPRDRPAFRDGHVCTDDPVTRAAESSHRAA